MRERGGGLKPHRLRVARTSSDIFPPQGSISPFFLWCLCVFLCVDFGEGCGLATPLWQRKAGKDPEGGLNAAGRASYKRETGGNLKAPVKGAPSGPNDLLRKGSFLVRMGSASGPLRDGKGRPTRLKLSLEAWGHGGDKASAVSHGRVLLARYNALKKRKK